MRYYWIHYRVEVRHSNGGAPKVLEGRSEIGRDLPICRMGDLLATANELSSSIAQAMLARGEISPGAAVSVNILNWIPFQEPSILLP